MGLCITIRDLTLFFLFFFHRLTMSRGLGARGRYPTRLATIAQVRQPSGWADNRTQQRTAQWCEQALSGVLCYGLALVILPMGMRMQGRSAVNSSIAGLLAQALFLLVICAVLAMRPAAAVETIGLYRVSLPVADRSLEARDAGFRQALAQVLVKVSGDSRITSQPPIQRALRQPASYVRQFAYRQPPATDTAQSALTLQVRFDPIAIDRLLRNGKLPLWGRERPLVILWIGVDPGNGQRFILGSQSDSPHAQVLQAVKQAARARGLPVVLPLMDLRDRGAVSFSDLSGGFVQPVLKASARYEANAVLIGTVRMRGGRWQGRWQLVFRDRRQQWTTVGSSAARAMAGGIGGGADRLASRLAVSESGASSQAVFVQVEGVKSVAAFARIEHLFDGLAPIKTAQLVSADEGRLVFRVVPRGRAGEVVRNLGLVNWLQVLHSGAVQGSSVGSGQTLYLRYTP